VDEVGRRVVEDDDLHRPAQGTTEVVLEVEGAGGERSGRRHPVQDRDVDIAVRAGRAAGLAAEGWWPFRRASSGPYRGG